MVFRGFIIQYTNFISGLNMEEKIKEESAKKEIIKEIEPEEKKKGPPEEHYEENEALVEILVGFD